MINAHTATRSSLQFSIDHLKEKHEETKLWCEMAIAEIEGIWRERGETEIRPSTQKVIDRVKEALAAEEDEIREAELLLSKQH